ncbi:pilus assembly protein [Frankia sp. AgPm24]|uniref:TadE family type IV pilus minor pilin n=1 Tax=Frankia sp. AgPm24 TaxID=631128 RepID=UPI00200EA7DB|nr:TadE family protein [Frankia sp. AgPm24]MCK9920870.1 pilus assembly protein [Frankia sp. AgPm24]
MGELGRQPRPADRDDDDRGQATAELAVGLPSLVAVFLLAVWMLAVLFGQGRCGNAAGIGARLAARGESDAIVTAAAAAAAPPHATVRLSRHDGLIDVEVSASIGMAALGQNGLRQVVSAHAVIPAESNPPPVADPDGDSPGGEEIHRGDGGGT